MSIACCCFLLADILPIWSDSHGRAPSVLVWIAFFCQGIAWFPNLRHLFYGTDLKGNHIGSFHRPVSRGCGCVKQIRGIVILDQFVID